MLLSVPPGHLFEEPIFQHIGIGDLAQVAAVGAHCIDCPGAATVAAEGDPLAIRAPGG